MGRNRGGDRTMTELEKLEFIHSTLQEVSQNEHADMIEKSLEFVEEIREKHFEKLEEIERWIELNGKN